MATMISAVPAICPRCGAQNIKGSLFCDSCRLYMRDSTMTVERATYTRRFFGDSLLEGLLFVLTLFVGWFIWMIFTSKTGQTPAKRLVDTYAINIETGRRIGRGDSWLREVVIKLLVVNAIGGVIPFASLIDAVWLFFDKDRQTLHDKVLKHVVVYAPRGLPEEMEYVEQAAPRYYSPPIISAQQQPIAPSPHVKDVADELRELQQLKDQGLVTDEEYERKRAALVEKI